MPKPTYTHIDAAKVEADFVARRAKDARWKQYLASLDAEQIAILAADPASLVDATHAATAADARAEAQAKADALVALSTEPDLAVEKTTWLAERLTSLESEHVALVWLRDHPDLDDDTTDRAEQVRQVEAALRVTRGKNKK